MLKHVHPVRPIIDELYAPIPLVSDAIDVGGISQDQWPTWIGLLELASGNKVQMLDRVAEVSQFLDTLQSSGSGGLPIPVGDFSVDGADALAPPRPQADIASRIKNPTPDDSGFASGVSSLPGIADVQSSGGFSFPIFNKPGNLFGYLLGKDISLLTRDAGSLEAEDDLALLPVFIPFGPVVVKATFGGFVGARAISSSPTTPTASARRCRQTASVRASTRSWAASCSMTTATGPRSRRSRCRRASTSPDPLTSGPRGRGAR